MALKDKKILAMIIGFSSKICGPAIKKKTTTIKKGNMILCVLFPLIKSKNKPNSKVSPQKIPYILRIASIQDSLIQLQEQQDKSVGNDRAVTSLKRQFDTQKRLLDKALKNLYDLGDDDSLIPLISEVYNEVN